MDAAVTKQIGRESLRKTTLSIALTLIVSATLLAACQSDEESPSESEAAQQVESTIEEEGTMSEPVPVTDLSATMKTSKGDIHLTLFATKTPITVTNFVNLAQRGYYDGLTFHRVLANFMIQGGCPLGTGTGDPGYKFQDEFDPSLTHDRPGILSMANAGPGTNGSQFFITHKETSNLDGKHSIFGAVVGPEDQAVVNEIAEGDIIESIVIEGDVAALFASTQSQLDEWNAILDK